MKKIGTYSRRVFFYLSIAAICESVSCTHNVVGPSSAKKSIFDIFGASGSSNYAGQFYSAYQNVENGGDFWAISASTASATVLDTNGHNKNLTGVITLGTNTLTNFGRGWYRCLHLSEWDSLQIWNITDTSQIGTFSDTIVCPSLFTISYPYQLMHNDSVSVSSGFTITYSSHSGDSVIVLLQSNSLLAHMIDSTISISSSEGNYVSTFLPNTGSFSISPSYLTSFPSHGVMDIFVVGVNSKVTSHSGRQYLYRSGVASQVSTFIKP